jgi:hypothetical protein
MKYVSLRTFFLGHKEIPKYISFIIWNSLESCYETNSIKPTNTWIDYFHYVIVIGANPLILQPWILNMRRDGACDLTLFCLKVI